MALRFRLFLAALLASASGLTAAVLGEPQGLRAESGSGSLSLSWSPVAGAGLYRVAVFAEAEENGKRPLLAAVWVNGHEYVYGKTATVAKAGKYPSTKPLPLEAGQSLRVMVAAARSDGSDKGEWVGMDVEMAVEEEASPTPTPIITGTSVEADAGKEPELQDGEEFKQTPDAAVLEIDEEEPAAASVKAASTVGEAKGLLSTGHFEQAETAYRALLEKDATDADLWEGLGDAYAGRRMKLEAKEAYEKALSLSKTKSHLKEWIDKNVRR